MQLITTQYSALIDPGSLIPWWPCQWRWNHFKFDNKWLLHCCSFLVRFPYVPILSTAGIKRRSCGCVAHYGIMISLASLKFRITLCACANGSPLTRSKLLLQLIVSYYRFSNGERCVYEYNVFVSLRYIHSRHQVPHLLHCWRLTSRQHWQIRCLWMVLNVQNWGKSSIGHQNTAHIIHGLSVPF